MSSTDHSFYVFFKVLLCLGAKQSHIGFMVGFRIWDEGLRLRI